MILHIVTKNAPHDSFHRAINSASYHDSILLMGDGVYASGMENALSELMGSTAKAVYALAPDCEARGMLKRLPANIIAASDEDFVDLVCEHDKSITWY